MTSPHCMALDAIALLATGTTALVATMVPATSDMVAVTGAMLATVISVLEARKKDRDLTNTISVVVGSSVVGSLAPGVLFYNLWPNFAGGFTWHVWAGLGFVCGLLGWSVVQLIFALRSFLKRRQDSLIDSWANRILRNNPPDDEKAGHDEGAE